MKVFSKGKELFEVEVDENIPETVEIDENTGWRDKWSLFAIMSLLNGNVKVNEDNVKEIIENKKEEDKNDR